MFSMIVSRKFLVLRSSRSACWRLVMSSWVATNPPSASGRLVMLMMRPSSRLLWATTGAPGERRPLRPPRPAAGEPVEQLAGTHRGIAGVALELEAVGDQRLERRAEPRELGRHRVHLEVAGGRH